MVLVRKNFKGARRPTICIMGTFMAIFLSQPWWFFYRVKKWTNLAGPTEAGSEYSFHNFK